MVLFAISMVASSLAQHGELLQLDGSMLGVWVENLVEVVTYLHTQLVLLFQTAPAVVRTVSA